MPGQTSLGPVSGVFLFSYLIYLILWAWGVCSWLLKKHFAFRAIKLVELPPCHSLGCSIMSLFCCCTVTCWVLCTPLMRLMRWKFSPGLRQKETFIFALIFAGRGFISLILRNNSSWNIGKTFIHLPSHGEMRRSPIHNSSIQPGLA